MYPLRTHAIRNGMLIFESVFETYIVAISNGSDRQLNVRLVLELLTSQSSKKRRDYVSCSVRWFFALFSVTALTLVKFGVRAHADKQNREN